jgi:putative ABC transport system permease protein
VTRLARALRLVPLVARELRRNPRRTSLTFLGLCVSFFLYTSLESVLHTLGRVVGATAAESVLFVRPRDRSAFFGSGLPEGYAGRVRGVPDVVEAAPLLFHFGQGRDEGSFAVALGVELERWLRIRRPEGLDETELARFRADRTGALVGRTLLEKNGWQVGGRASIRGVGLGPELAFRIVGDLEGEDRSGRVAILHLDYVQEVSGQPGRATFVQARVAHAELAPAVARAIDSAFANHTVPTETTTERAHVATLLGSLSEVLGALRAIGYLTLAVTVLVVGNSVAMGIRERTVELGTLRALGFGRGRVVALVLGEAILVSIPGALLGAGAAWALFASGVVVIPNAEFPLVSDGSLVLRSAALGVPVGALAGLQPALAAVRMAITDALRFAE